MILSFFFIAVGVGLLYAGAEMLVRGSVALSKKFRVTPLLVGLIVIGLGTSSPELVVSVEAAVMGNGELAIGNIIGSNISNLALILGIAALIYPVSADKTLMRLEIPVLVVASVMLTWMLLDNVLSLVNSLLLLSFLGGYLFFTIKNNIMPRTDEIETTIIHKKTSIIALITVAGLLLLVIGAHIMVKGASELAVIFGIGEGIIGLTVVAVGTSLPELAMVVVASMKKQGELILGALIGSNILNILFVLGTTGAVAYLIGGDMPLRDIITPDLIVMTALAFLMIPVIFTRNQVSRLEGGVLFACYIGYIAWLFIR